MKNRRAPLASLRGPRSRFPGVVVAFAAALLATAFASPGVLAATTSSSAPPSSHARGVPPSRKYAAELAVADSLMFRRGGVAEAYLDSLIAAARARSDSGLEMVASIARASRWAYIEGRFDEAQAESRRWLPGARAAHDTLSWCRSLRTIGYADFIRHRYTEARSSFEPMLRLARLAHLEVMEGFALIGTSYDALLDGRLHEAERGYRRSTRLLTAHGEVYAARSARAGLANALFQQGEADSARAEYERVLIESQAVGDLRNAADAVNDLGSIEFQYGDASLAAPIFRQAGELQTRLGRKGHALVSLCNVALCYLASGRDVEAAALEDSVIAAAESTRTTDVLVRSLGDLGGLRQRQGRLAEAETLARRAVALGDSSGLAAWVGAEMDLARVLIRQGRVNEARDLLDGPLKEQAMSLGPAAHAAWLSTVGTAKMESGDARAALTPLRDASALRRGLGGAMGAAGIGDETLLARAFLALGRRDSALARFRMAADLWEASRAKPRDLSWRESFGSSAARLYGAYAMALLDSARGGTATSRAAEAFALMQRFRARTFEDGLRGARTTSPLPRVTLASLQHVTLRPGEIFIDLFSAPDTSVIFAVTQDGIVAAGIASEWGLIPRLRRFRDLLADATTDAEAIRSAAAALGAEILGPVVAPTRGAKTVLLSAGELDQFPLGMLVLPGEEQALTATRRFAVVPSATLIAASRAASGHAAVHGGLLALSRSTDDRGRRLEGVAREARWLSQTFPAAEVRENDGQRTLDDMLARVGSHEILHVAAHTRGSAGAPWRAGFLLGRGEREDAYLTAPRIAGFERPAHVCVLAGCASVGSTTRYEAMPSLAGAWLACGVSAVIATLWPVDDDATADLMQNFYGELSRGKTAGAALAEAQREARSRGVGPARDWSGFVLFGDPETHVALDAAVAQGARPQH